MVTGLPQVEREVAQAVGEEASEDEEVVQRGHDHCDGFQSVELGVQLEAVDDGGEDGEDEGACDDQFG